MGYYKRDYCFECKGMTRHIGDDCEECNSITITINGKEISDFLRDAQGRGNSQKVKLDQHFQERDKYFQKINEIFAKYGKLLYIDNNGDWKVKDYLGWRMESRGEDIAEIIPEKPNGTDHKTEFSLVTCYKCGKIIQLQENENYQCSCGIIHRYQVDANLNPLALEDHISCQRCNSLVYVEKGETKCFMCGFSLDK